MKRNRMAELLAMKSDDLYALLAPPTKMRPFPPGLSAAERRQMELAAARRRTRQGRQRFARIRPALFKRLCVDWDYCRRMNDGSLDNALTVATAVAGLIPHLYMFTSSAVVAAILVKMGLSQFCGCSVGAKREKTQKRKGTRSAA